MQTLLQNQVVEAIAVTLERVNKSGQLPMGAIPTPMVEPPKRPEWGDFSCNVAMTLASRVRQSPLKVAEVLAASLREQFSELFERIDVAPPGFLNLTLHPVCWMEVLRTIQEHGSAYGESHIGKGKRIVLEFVSANPTGPLHVGHGRGAALGQAMASLLTAAGFKVLREFYVNDAGRQLHLLGRSVYARYREYWGKDSSFPEEGYHGDYIKSLAESVAQTHGQELLEKSPDQAETVCAQIASHILLDGIKDDLETFGVQFETWFSEASLHSKGLVQLTLDELRERKLVKDKDGALWFRSSEFGDEKDRVLKKQDGSYTYLAADMAYHRDKLERGFDTLINIWGADHHGYIPRMEATVQAFGHTKESLRVVLVQMVSLLRGSQKIEMSKRAGRLVTMEELVNEVGADAAKFFFLARKNTSHLDFDLTLAKAESNDNPAWYVKYAHARICSVFRNAEAQGVALDAWSLDDLNRLEEESELALLRLLPKLEETVAKAAASREISRLTSFATSVAAAYHQFYQACTILGDDEQRTRARLALCRGCQIVLANTLELIGIEAPERM